jgi:hypothetical protein
MFEKVAEDKWSGRKVYHWLKFELNFQTTGNKNLAVGNIYRILMNPFYYGVFEFPKKSGNWYTGKHEPIVTKELFEKVQEQLKRDNIVRQSHEFAFTKLMTCGLCSSGISAEEKYKQLKDGTVAKYIYYGCGRSKDRNCKSLIEQLVGLIDKIDLDEIGTKEKIKAEIDRHRKFQSGLLGIKEKPPKVEEIDIRNYAKYLLREGGIVEKREFLTCLRSKITVNNKRVQILTPIEHL